MEEQIARLLAEQDGYEWEDLQTDYTDMYYRMAKEICELFKPKGGWQKEQIKELIQQAKIEVFDGIIKLVDDLKNSEEAFVDDVDFRCPNYKGDPLWDIDGMYKHLEAHKQTYKKIRETIESLKSNKMVEQ